MEGLIVALTGLISAIVGSGVIFLFWKSNRAKEIAGWKKDISQSELDTSKNRLEKITTDQDQIVYLGEIVNSLQIQVTDMKLQSAKIGDDLQLANYKITSINNRGRIFAAQVIDILEAIKENCDCDEDTANKILELENHAKTRSPE